MLIKHVNEPFPKKPENPSLTKMMKSAYPDIHHGQ
jgi:hypothetical protein